MDVTTELDKISGLIYDSPAKALKQLKKLQDHNPDNIDITWYTVLTLQAMDQHDKARELAVTLEARKNNDADYWIMRSQLWQENNEAALQDINKGLAYLPNDLGLLQHKAHALNELKQREAALNIYRDIITANPNNTEPLLSFAGFLTSIAYSPSDTDEKVTDTMGIEYSKSLLDEAIEQYNQALAIDNSWRILTKRAECYRRLRQEEKAKADYDTAIAQCPDDSPLKEHLISMSQDPKDTLAKTLTDIMQNQTNTTFEDHQANQLLDAMINRLKEGDDMTRVADAFLNEDPDDFDATQIAKSLFDLGNVPPPNMQAANAAEFPSYMRDHADSAKKQLSKLGFTCIGDYEPTHLTRQIGLRVLLRCFLAQDGKTCAASYAVRPLWPGFINWLILFVMGKWKTYRVIDCESEAANEFITTSNAGSIAEFEYGDNIKVLQLPSGTSIKTVVTTHEQRLTQLDSVTDLRTFSDVQALQNRQQTAKNDYRKMINYVTDAELHKQLHNNYDRLATKVREKINVMAGK